MNVPCKLSRPLAAAAAVALVAAAPAAATHRGDLQVGHTLSGNVTSGLSGSIDAPLFQARNANAGSSPVGLLGTITSAAAGADSAGVRGLNSGAGHGVFGQAVTGAGVYGLHSASTGGHPGVRGVSASRHASAAGVLGRITSTQPGQESAGVRGTNAGTGGGGFGVWGSHAGAGPGVEGTSANGFGGRFTSQNYRGMYVRGGPSWIAAYVDGWAYVNGNMDVTANAHVSGDLSVGGDCVGCSDARSARNSGETAIAPGDLVAAAGVEVVRGEPVLLVRRAMEDDDAVIGVATTALAPAARAEGGDGVVRTALAPARGQAAPDGYVRVITSGLAQVRVDGSAIRIGARLAPGGGGRATRDTGDRSVGRVVGEPDGKGLAWALIDAG